MQNNLQLIREKFLDLAIMKLEKWEEINFSQISEEAGFDLNYYLLLFENPIRDLISVYETKTDQSMLDFLDKREEKSVSKTIYNALEYRIMSSLKANIEFFMKPGNLLFAKKINFRTVDLIWRYIEKKHNIEAHNFNFYTKRISLYLVYLISLIYFMQDSSIDKIKTKQLLQKLIDNFKNIGMLKAKLRELYMKATQNI